MKKISLFAVVTCILVSIICFNIIGTVHSQEANQGKIEDAYQDKMEDDYVEQVRTTLETEHLYHSGITMTKVTYENEQKEYQVVIHNGRIDKMSAYEKQQLLKKLEKIAFPDNNGSVSHQFLELS